MVEGDLYEFQWRGFINISKELRIKYTKKRLAYLTTVSDTSFKKIHFYKILSYYIRSLCISDICYLLFNNFLKINHYSLAMKFGISYIKKRNKKIKYPRWQNTCRIPGDKLCKTGDRQHIFLPYSILKF